MNKQIETVFSRIGRRDFLVQSALGTAGLVIGSSACSDAARAAEVPEWLRSHQQRTPLAPAPKIIDVRHIRLCYDPATYCGHPRQAIFKYFGGGEMIVGHNHAPCRYEKRSDVGHGYQGGYHSRSVVLLQRSVDSCRTWPEDQNVVVYDETRPAEEKRKFLYQKDARREQYDMFRPESVFFFGRTLLPGCGRVKVCYVLRSADKGRTWEKVPTIIRHPDDEKLWVHKDCHPVVRMPDGKTLLAAMSIGAPGAQPCRLRLDRPWSFVGVSQPRGRRSDGNGPNDVRRTALAARRPAAVLLPAHLQGHPC